MCVQFLVFPSSYSHNEKTAGNSSVCRDSDGNAIELKFSAHTFFNLEEKGVVCLKVEERGCCGRGGVGWVAVNRSSFIQFEIVCSDLPVRPTCLEPEPTPNKQQQCSVCPCRTWKTKQSTKLLVLCSS